MPVLKRLALSGLLLFVLCVAGLYYFNRYWVHRYDALIAQQAAIYRIDPDLVWSIIYEETYFSPWKRGEAGEIVAQPGPGGAAIEQDLRDEEEGVEREAQGV